jgi:hypothetical protein
MDSLPEFVDPGDQVAVYINSLSSTSENADQFAATDYRQALNPQRFHQTLPLTRQAMLRKRHPRSKFRQWYAHLL